MTSHNTPLCTSSHVFSRPEGKLYGYHTPPLHRSMRSYVRGQCFFREGDPVSAPRTRSAFVRPDAFSGSMRYIVHMRRELGRHDIDEPARSRTMTSWEANNPQQMMQLLVGDHFGDRPEEKLESIRAEKEKRAARLCAWLGCDKSSTVLEIGSGMGLTSKHVADRVQRLVCCDISESFLEAARRECTGIPNIEFLKLDGRAGELPFGDAEFDAVYSDAVFIHLNLYDIYWYFSEFARIVKKGGRVFINIMNDSKTDFGKLIEMAAYYRKSPSALGNLLCWNSTDAVLAVASHFGFRLEQRARVRALLQSRRSQTKDLLFTKV